jgi:tRNA modification GTPase
MHPREQTIFALSSGQLPSAIAIVRISGPEAATALTVLAGKIPPPRMATRALLRDGTRQPIDDALVLWFPGPASATGEDVAERPWRAWGSGGVVRGALGVRRCARGGAG